MSAHAPDTGTKEPSPDWIEAAIFLAPAPFLAYYFVSHWACWYQ